MKHFIISKTQLEWINTMIGETKWNFLKLQKLPELNRLSDEEIYSLEEPAKQKWNAKADEQNGWDSLGWDEIVVLMGHEIMDKLGVPG